MEIRQRKHKITGSKFRLVFLGDMHIGTIHCEEDRLQADIQKIAEDPDCRTIVIGDCIEGINLTDKRFDPAVLSRRYMAADLGKLAQIQTSDFVRFMTPAKLKIDGFHRGNHEDVVFRRYHYDVTDGVLAGLNLSTDCFLNYAAILRYTVENEQGQTARFSVYSEHGTGWSRTAEMALRRIKTKQNDVDVDVYICGHHHKRIHDIVPTITIDWQAGQGKRLKERRKGFGVTGAYLKTMVEGVSGYAEMRSLSPVELGSLVVEYDLGTGHFEMHNW